MLKSVSVACSLLRELLVCRQNPVEVFKTLFPRRANDAQVLSIIAVQVMANDVAVGW